MPRRKTVQPKPLETWIEDDYVFEVRDEACREIGRGLHKRDAYLTKRDRVLEWVVPIYLSSEGPKSLRSEDDFLRSGGAFARKVAEQMPDLLPASGELDAIRKRLYKDVIKGSSHEDDVKVDNSNFLRAIWTILLADFTMSLDNVLGVAGAAGDHYTLLVFGLILSIILMATAATLISNWIKKYKWIAWAGLLAILIVAIELIYTDIKILFL